MMSQVRVFSANLEYSGTSITLIFDKNVNYEQDYIRFNLYKRVL